MRFLPNPTDPDAGTNRTNAVSRDNLMNGLGLKYNGQYINKDLDFVGTDGFWWMSAIRNNTYSYSSRINTDGYIYPQGQSVQNMGRAVRCIPPYSTGSLGARSYPLSYVYSGSYYWDTGRLYYQTLRGAYWSSSIVSSTDSYYLYMYSTRLIKAGSFNKRLGVALRCLPHNAK